MDAFDVLDNLYAIFTADSVLMDLLVDTSAMTPEETLEAYDSNVRRSVADATLIDPAELPFFDFSFVDGHNDSQNHLLCRSPIEFNIYAQNYYMASLVYKEIHRLLKDNFEDAQVSNGRQRLTPLQGMYCHTFKIKQFVGS